jgi:hypothetical protein
VSECAPAKRCVTPHVRHERVERLLDVADEALAVKENVPVCVDLQVKSSVFGRMKTMPCAL